MSIDKLKTKFFTGAWLTDVKHYFTKINEIIDYLNGDGSSLNGSYKQFIANFKQDGTDIPVLDILVNTTGISVGEWVRPYAGFYRAPMVGLTKDNTIGRFGNWDGNAGTYQVISDGSVLLGYITYYVPNSNDALWVEVYDDTFTLVDYSTLFTSAQNKPKYPIELKLFS